MPHRSADLPLLQRSKPSLHVHDEEALNAEPPPELLVDAITPTDRFFVRNNGTLPQTGRVEDWRLSIDGEVERPMVWSLAALREQFETVTQTAVLECAGNGRSQFVPATDGLPWRLGAVGCARWTGVRLKDVLEHSGVKPSAVYTGHYAPDRAFSNPEKPALSRGLPIAKALSPETLLAFGMNGEPLTALHGGPLRIVAPGYPGSAWQKWLDRVSLRDREHDGEKMRGTDYRMPRRTFLPGEPLDPALFEVITDMPVKSLIASPAPGFSVAVGSTLAVKGFAWSGAVPLAGLRASCDGGESWRDVALADGEGPYGWRAFRAEFAITRPGPLTVMTQAFDVEGNVQPLDIVWNPRGYCNNQVQRVSGVAHPA